MISIEELVNTAHHFCDKRDYNTGLKIYLEANQIQPNNSTTLNNIGSVYHLLNNSNEALKYLTEANKIQPNNSTTLNNIGFAYNNLNNPNEALKYLTEANETQPYAPFVLGNIAISYKLLGNKEKAIENLKIAATKLKKRGRGIAQEHKFAFKTLKKEFENFGLNIIDYIPSKSN
jgi:tetratricopeptide (TPR) repeat protein